MASSSNKKKSASQASRGNPANYSQIYKNAAAGATPVNTAPPPAAKSAAPTAAAATNAPVARVRTSDDVDWGHEYAYVLGDLKRLALVTAGLVVAIIVAGLFI